MVFLDPAVGDAHGTLVPVVVFNGTFWLAVYSTEPDNSPSSNQGGVLVSKSPLSQNPDPSKTFLACDKHVNFQVSEKYPKRSQNFLTYYITPVIPQVTHRFRVAAVCMSAKHMSRRLQLPQLGRPGQALSGYRCYFRYPVPRPGLGGASGAAFGGGPAGGSGSKRASVYNGNSIFAVATAAGVLGWGMAQFSDNKPKDTAQPASSSANVAFDNSRPIPPPKYAGVDDLKEALREIRLQLGDDDVISTDPEDLHAHGYSEWSTVNPEGLPVAVAYPRSTEDVSTIARVCFKYRVPIIPYSGGSSLEGNFAAPYGGISVDFAYMDQIVEFNQEDMDIVVQPSIGWQDLNAKLATMGSDLFFPIDPGPSAKIGGMIGTNCSGTNAVRYGTMKDWVINVTVVLADGRVIKTRRRPRKSSAGYNLTGMFVGSEGTLGLVTEAALKLAVVPEHQMVAVVPFPSIRSAAAAAAQVMQTGIPVAAMEIMDEVQMKVVNLGGATAPRIWKEVPTLFFKFSGTKKAVEEHVDRVQQIASSHEGMKFEFANGEREQKLLWSARKEALWSMLALRKDGDEVWSTDVAVPFSRLAELIEISKKEMDELGMFASILGHIGDGNFHESIIYNATDPEERKKVERCVNNMVNRALEMEGTCTGEHSVGWGKKESLKKEVGLETIEMMKAIKFSLDPLWIMNPGKIVDIPS
ncbi:glycolate oxidase [Zalerion maritima]|uniref:D-lactate dehydrogenase (cytochrome) n=1 Tax=Zalerion maritima TaxID=339359 RepID=A0AAD5RRX8_9PEZI|nr:glycolate oxidase [Zalerion maritima]